MNKKVPSKVVFIIMGILATLWFLIRVIPKPQRAGYPCMKAAFPFMTAFVIWLLSVTGSLAAFKIAKSRLIARKYIVGGAFIIAAVAFAANGFVQYSRNAEAADNYVDNDFYSGNEPMGVPVGHQPGRVVWVHNPDATNENGGGTKEDHYYWVENNNQEVISDMFEEAILKLTSEKTLSGAWDEIFKSFNKKKSGVAEVYQPGQTIYIKVNNGTSSWAADSDLNVKSTRNPTAETSPFSIYALVDHLVNVVGVNESDIIIADPRSSVWAYHADYLKADFPNLKIGDKDPAKVTKFDRYQLTENENAIMHYSDKGAVMTGAITDKFFDEMTEADYIINIGALKAHARAGITITSKNHFGSHYRGSAEHLHPSLVAPNNDTPLGSTTGYGKYRVFVDIMGHEKIGQNTLLFFVDGLWGGPEATDPPEQFTSKPFNGDWSNSLLLSMDQVALESVCFDILRYEYNNPDNLQEYRPHMYGVTDYLRQAADPANWPEGITYDPENDGTPLTSLGVHEHWNNSLLRQYSRNLGIPEGIELLTSPEALAPSFPFVARKVSQSPVFDGDGSDAVWQESPWYPINHVWIDYGAEIPESDNSASFKVVWSQEENLLYYLVKLTDDVFVDGYEYPNTGYPNYDIVEVFIDEDASGGAHVFDKTGENAENAFSYHIAADAPADGEVTYTKVVADIAGTGWGDRITPDYASHFPNFAMKKSGNDYIYEFSMAVYTDDYVDSDPEASRSSLFIGKIMGMSVAICDNDGFDGNRDHFFGSVYVTEENYNDHWQLADDYGKFALGDEFGMIPTEANAAPIITSTVDDYLIQQLGQNETVVMDVNALFEDPDGDILEFSVSSSSSMVHAFFFGDQLRVRADEGFSGTATITLSAFDGIEKVSISFEVSSTVNVYEKLLDNSLSLFPNPVTNGYLDVSFNENNNGDVYIRIFNLNGQLVDSYNFRKTYSEFNERLEISHIDNGFYMLEIQFNGEKSVRRFTK